MQAVSEGWDHFWGHVPTLNLRFSAAIEPIFDLLDTFSDVSNLKNTLVLLFPGHLTPIGQFSRPVFFFGPKKTVEKSSRWESDAPEIIAPACPACSEHQKFCPTDRESIH